MKGLIYAIGACALYVVTSAGCVNEKYTTLQKEHLALQRDYLALQQERNKNIQMETKVLNEILARDEREIKKLLLQIITNGNRLQQGMTALENAAQKSGKSK